MATEWQWRDADNGRSLQAAATPDPDVCILLDLRLREHNWRGIYDVYYRSSRGGDWQLLVRINPEGLIKAEAGVYADGKITADIRRAE